MSVPTFLHNRPRQFVVHCMRRLQSESQLKVFTDSGAVTVSGGDSSYEVSTTSENAINLPNCTCPDWHRTYKPCKHMMKALSAGYIHWASFPNEYRNFPLFCLDYHAINSSQLLVDTSSSVPVDSHVVDTSSRVPVDSHVVDISTSVPVDSHIVDTSSSVPVDSHVVDTSSSVLVDSHIVDTSSSVPVDSHVVDTSSSVLVDSHVVDISTNVQVDSHIVDTSSSSVPVDSHVVDISTNVPVNSHVLDVAADDPVKFSDDSLRGKF